MSRSDESGGKDEGIHPEIRNERIVDEDLTEEQILKLEQRLEDANKNPAEAVTWEELQERLKAVRRGR